MRRQSKLAAFLALIMAAAGATQVAAQDAPLPALKRNGATVQLMVDGRPYIALAGEVHNSTGSSSAYMAPVWGRLDALHVNTVITPAYWELIEPVEGRFDFTLIDEQLRQARAHKVRLVLLWFGALKNAQSTYAPAWVRADASRFPRAVIRSAGAAPVRSDPPVSVFGQAIGAADARAFGKLMAHLAAVDRQHTVIAVQVENETGLLGDSRDRSAPAQVAWRAAVPGELMRYLDAHRATLEPTLAAAWSRSGYRRSGSWAQVFGDDWQGEEIFMAWGVARLVDRVAAAGKAQLPLPMYANAWLGPQQPKDIAGAYPSGGPVPRVFDVWRSGAPHLDWLSPDIYAGDFNTWAKTYARADNPLFIPETRFVLGNLFTALGAQRAIGFAPFGIEDGLPDSQIADAYGQLGGMAGLIADAQAKGTLMGFALEAGQTGQAQLGGYVVSVRGGRETMRRTLLDLGVHLPDDAPQTRRQNQGAGFADMTDLRPSGIVVQTGPDEFVVVGKDLDLTFRRGGERVAAEIERVEEGRYVDGAWIAGRVLNGDERLSILPFDTVGVVRIKLLRPR